ncbi:MAG: transcription antitermination factor NusB [Gammaproteobacteria bacterium]
MSGPRPDRVSARARSRARRLAMQALYQWQMGGEPAGVLCAQFSASTGFDRADQAYFRELVERIIAGKDRIEARMAEFGDREGALLDPVEHAILLIGVYELERRPDVPYRVVINEAVELAKRFGAAEAHKYVNAVLDSAARSLRGTERLAHR